MDIWGAYRVQVVEALVRRLPYEARSLYRAKSLGNEDKWRQWLEWTDVNFQLADILDALKLLTKATAQQKAMLRDADLYPRPQVERRTRTISTRDTDSVAALIAALN